MSSWEFVGRKVITAQTTASTSRGAAGHTRRYNGLWFPVEPMPTGLPSLATTTFKYLILGWLRGRDLNPRPLGYENKVAQFKPVFARFRLVYKVLPVNELSRVPPFILPLTF